MSFTESVESLVDADMSGLLSDLGGYPRAPLGELCEILNGFAFKSQQFSATDGVPLIRIRDVVRGETETYYTGEYDDRYLVHRGELVVGMDGDFNSALWAGRTSLLNQRVCKLTPKDDRVSVEYIAYALPGYLKVINQHTSSITVKHLSSRTVAQIPLPVPPRDVQDALVSALDSYFSRLDDAVANLERVQRNLKRYRASVLKAAVEGRLVPTEAELARAEGRDYEPASVLLERILAERRRRWEEAELEKMLAKGKPPKNDKWKAKYKEPAEPDLDGLPELPGGWFWATFDQLFETVADRGRKLPQRDYNETGDLPVIDQGAAYIGGRTDRAELVYQGPLPVVVFGDHTRVVKLVHEPFVVGADGVKLLAPAEGVIARFASLMVQTRQLPDKGYARHFQYLRAACFPLPPEAEQARIIDEVERLDSSARHTAGAVVRQIDRCALLRQSLLRSAFSGALLPAAAELVEA